MVQRVITMFRSTPFRLLGATALWVVVAISSDATQAVGNEIDFGRDVRPILSANCFSCHGPDPDDREADLRLDTREGAIDESSAFVGGDLEASDAWVRITSDEPDARMPPPDSGKQLTPQQQQLIRRWIEQGATWSRHWAFVPPSRPSIPSVSQPEWVRNPIDAFVLARLDHEGLNPSPPADRVTLLRRMSLDLIGLPPKLAEIDAFLSDESEQAIESVIARLVDSPHYGERWGRWWLDAARYADSDGFEKDKPRQVWFYRDWVINALNRDLPYNEFVIQQLAGDLYPNATQDNLIATGFLRNSMINEEGGIDPEQFRMEAMFDRMDAVGKSVLGLTVGCAQCHNHKYDALSQAEYYRMFAFLNNSHEAQIAVYTEDEQRRRQDMFASIDRIDQGLKKSDPHWATSLAAWEREQTERADSQWHVAKLSFDDTTIGGQKFLPQSDGSYLAQGYAPTKFQPKMTTETDLNTITGIRLELLTDPNLPRGGPGRSTDGTCGLSEIEIEVTPRSQPLKVQKVKITGATADVAAPTSPLKQAYDDRAETKRIIGNVDFAFDGDELTAWTTDVGSGRSNQPRTAVFQLEQLPHSKDGFIVHIYLSQKHGGWNSDDNQTFNLGRFRLSLTSSPDPEAHPVPPLIREIVAIPSTDRTVEQSRELFGHWRATRPDWGEAHERAEQLWKQHPSGTTQLVLSERNRVRSTHRLERGDFLQKREATTPGVPEFLHPLADETPTRLSFARWLVDDRSPTTARAIVNRVWQSYFGRGIVETSEDLGSQGELPTHPELLDWLATEFMKDGWSLKRLHRWIVSSSTYRQSSHVTPELYARDPYNRLLARGSRFRVDAEIVRDIALSTSGLLNDTIGGPSVYPPAPEFLFKPPASYGPKVWAYSTGSDRYRRSIYTFRFRSVPFPALQAFDAPNGDSSCVRRSRSNTPLQALTTLNEALFVQCARALALQSVSCSSEDATRLSFIFRRCTSREPTDKEASVLLSMLSKQYERWSSADTNPWELAADDPDDPPKLPEGVSASQLAAWTAVARVVLNLDETITRE